MMLTTELLFPFLCQLFIFFIIFINFIQLHFSQNFSPCWWRSWRDRDSRFWWWSTDVLLWKCFRRSNHPGVSSTWNLLDQMRDFSPQYLYIFMKKCARKRDNINQRILHDLTPNSGGSNEKKCITDTVDNWSLVHGMSRGQYWHTCLTRE